MEWRKRESGNAAGISGKQIQTDRVSVRRFSFGAESVLTDTFPAETKRRKLPANLWKYCFRRIVPAADLRPRQGFFHCFSQNTCAALRQNRLSAVVPLFFGVPRREEPGARSPVYIVREHGRFRVAFLRSAAERLGGTDVKNGKGRGSDGGSIAPLL